jgi:hypothetical protein
LVAARTTAPIREASIVSPTSGTRVVEYGLDRAEGSRPGNSTSGAVGISPSPGQRSVSGHVQRIASSIGLRSSGERGLAGEGGGWSARLGLYAPPRAARTGLSVSQT